MTFIDGITYLFILLDGSIEPGDIYTTAFVLMCLDFYEVTYLPCSINKNKIILG